MSGPKSAEVYVDRGQRLWNEIDQVLRDDSRRLRTDAEAMAKRFRGSLDTGTGGLPPRLPEPAALAELRRCARTVARSEGARLAADRVAAFEQAVSALETAYSELNGTWETLARGVKESTDAYRAMVARGRSAITSIPMSATDRSLAQKIKAARDGVLPNYKKWQRNLSSQGPRLLGDRKRLEAECEALLGQGRALGDELRALLEAERLREERARRLAELAGAIGSAEATLSACPDAAFLDTEGRLAGFAEGVAAFRGCLSRGEEDEAIASASAFAARYAAYAGEIQARQLHYTAECNAAQAAIENFSAVLVPDEDVDAWSRMPSASRDAAEAIAAARSALEQKRPEGVAQQLEEATQRYLDAVQKARDNRRKDERRRNTAELLVEALRASNYYEPDVFFSEDGVGDQLDDLVIYAEAPGTEMKTRITVPLDGGPTFCLGRETESGELIEVTEADGVACHTQLTALQETLRTEFDATLDVTDWGKARMRQGGIYALPKEVTKTKVKMRQGQ